MGQCEDDSKIPFPVVHSILTRRECISFIFWLIERQIRDKKLQLKCGCCVKTTSGITPYIYNLYSRDPIKNFLATKVCSFRHVFSWKIQCREFSPNLTRECRPSGSRVPVKCFKNCIPSLKSISRTKNINICYCPRAQPWPCSRCWSSWTWSACWTPSTSSSASGFRPRPSTPGTWHSQVEWSSLVVTVNVVSK